MDLTITQVGTFTSNGNNVNLNLRAGTTWIRTYNYTQALAAQIGAVGVEFYWQQGMPQDSAFERTKGVLDAVGQFVVVAGGFSVFDTAANPVGTLHNDVNAISAAAIPVVTEVVANGLTSGDVVRLTNCAGCAQLNGMDFTVGYSTLTAGTFSLEYMPQIVAGGATGNWQKITSGSFDSSFYPTRRFITAISNAAQAVIRLSVRHMYTVGQKVRISVPAGKNALPVYGMVIPPTIATIVAVDTGTAAANNTITVDLDTTGLNPFVFPLTAVAANGFTPATVVPVGEDTGVALTAGTDILADATRDVNYMGVTLAAGVDSPAGRNGDVIYWAAGNTFA